jgi:hypothetical protein
MLDWSCTTDKSFPSNNLFANEKATKLNQCRYKLGQDERTHLQEASQTKRASLNRGEPKKLIAGEQGRRPTEDAQKTLETLSRGA